MHLTSWQAPSQCNGVTQPVGLWVAPMLARWQAGTVQASWLAGAGWLAHRQPDPPPCLLLLLLARC